MKKCDLDEILKLYQPGDDISKIGKWCISFHSTKTDFLQTYHYIVRFMERHFAKKKI